MPTNIAFLAAYNANRLTRPKYKKKKGLVTSGSVSIRHWLRRTLGRLNFNQL